MSRALSQADAGVGIANATLACNAEPRELRQRRQLGGREMPIEAGRKTTNGKTRKQSSGGKNNQSRLAWVWRLISPASAETIRKLAIDTFIVAAIVIALFVALKATMNTAVRFEPISVPKALADRGLTGEVVAQRIIDETVRIRERPTSMRIGNFLSSPIERALPKVETPVGGFSLAPVVSYLRELLGVTDTRVAGEIVATLGPVIRTGVQSPQQHTKYTLSMRVVDRVIVGVRTKPNEDIDALITEAAFQLMEKLHPFLLAAYYYREGKNSEKKRNEKYEEIIRLLSLCLNNDFAEDDARALNLYGLLLDDEGKHDEAISEFRNVINRYTDFAPSYYNLAQTLIFDKKMYQEGLLTAIKGIQIDSDPRAPAIGYSTAAIALNRMDRHQEAVRYARLALDHNPLDHRSHGSHGHALFALDRFDQAADAFRRSAEIEPKDAWTFAYWGRALAWLYKKPSPSQALVKIAGEEFFLPDILAIWRAASIEQTSIPEQATEKLKRASRMAPRDGLLQNDLGEVYELLGHLEEAIGAYERAIKADKSRWVTLVGKVKRLRELPAPF